MRLADIFHILVRLTVMDCCGIATVTVMADKVARLTDIRAKNARLCGYRTPYNTPTFMVVIFGVISWYFELPHYFLSMHSERRLRDMCACKHVYAI